MFKAHPLRTRLKAFFKSTFGSALLGAGFTTLCGLVLAAFSINILNDYGWSLFVGVPIFCGFTSAFIYSLQDERTMGGAIIVTMVSLVLLGLMIAVFAIEGVICMIMAAPLSITLAIPSAALGDFFGHRLYRKKNPLPPIVGLVFLMPLLMGFESQLDLKPPVRKVVTFIDIKASPATVWKSVVAFPPIPEPDELIFKAGIAYPQNATIKGKGVGAMRYCNFSTGPFVEPITVWDEPRLLKFDVVQNPMPMKEWSFYRDLQPPHMHNFMISQGGQFKLTRLNATTTRLEGTTWYHHKLWPSGYWGVISDDIIHKIHRRVLEHIKVQAE